MQTIFLDQSQLFSLSLQSGGAKQFYKVLWKLLSMWWAKTSHWVSISSISGRNFSGYSQPRPYIIANISVPITASFSSFVSDWWKPESAWQSYIPINCQPNRMRFTHYSFCHSILNNQSPISLCFSSFKNSPLPQLSLQLFLLTLRGDEQKEYLFEENLIKCPEIQHRLLTNPHQGTGHQ